MPDPTTIEHRCETDTMEKSRWRARVTDNCCKLSLKAIMEPLTQLINNFMHL